MNYSSYSLKTPSRGPDRGLCRGLLQGDILTRSVN